MHILSYFVLLLQVEMQKNHKDATLFSNKIAWQKK